ncbi:putative ribonuclease H-like domain-containing protein, partial [Tanacetum coccineum]
MSTIKLSILKKGEYDIWAMKMEHYLGHIDYPIWEVIQKGNGPVQVSTDTNGQIRVLPSKTAEEILARERERKARTTLLMSIPKDHLAKFHKMTDAKEMWEAIKSRFGGNDESKKIQLKIHGASVSTEDANKKFPRSLLASWSQVSLIMRTKPGVDSLSFDDLYNNLRVFEHDVKGFTASSSSTQNVAFVSSESTSSTNEVSTAYGVSTSSSYNSQREGSSSYTDELMYSFFANQSSGPQLDYEDLEQVDEFDLEEIDLKWQVAMISMRLKKFYKNTGRKLQFDAKEPVGFDKTNVECFNCHKIGHFVRERPTKQDEPKAMVTIDGDGVDWTGHAEDDQENFALMAYSNSGSDTEKLLAEAVKEKEELKTKLESFQSSSKGLSKLLNSQMSAKDKSGLGYGDQIHEGVLSYQNEVLQSMFDSRSSDVEDRPINDRFAKVEGMHAVPPPMIGIYMPPKSDFGIDESMFTYGPKQSKTSESDAETSNFASCESNSSVETLEYVRKLVLNEPKAVSEPKVWSDAPVIEEYESDSDNEYVFKALVEQEKLSCAFINIVKHVKTPRQTVKEQETCSQYPKVDKRDWNGLMSKKLGLGYGFTRKACFGKGTGPGENRLVLTNVQRLNHQNKFVPTAVLTKTGRFPINAARQKFSSQAASTSTARKVNTTISIVNEIRLRNNFYKSHSPIRRPFNRTTTPKANFSYHKVNTAGDKIVSAIGGNRETAVKASADCDWRSKRHYWKKVSKYNSGSNSSKSVDDPQKALKNKWIVDSGCSRHMTGNKAYLVEYHDYNGGPVAFEGSKGQITGKEFKNRELIEFCGSNGIKRKYINARTPQQNGVAKRKNMTLIEAARTMLVDLFLPNTFWVEAVSTACYVLNKVLVTKPQNKTPYELLTGKIPIISYIRPFGCHVAILNTIDHLGKFAGKSDEGFLVGYSLNSKAFRVYNLETKRVEENLHINFLENKPNVIGKGPTWLFDLDYLTDSMNYQLVRSENQANKTVGPKEAKNSAETNNGDENPNGDNDSKTNKEPIDHEDRAFLEELERLKRQEKEAYDAAEVLRKEFAQSTKDLLLQAGATRATSTNTVNTVSTQDIYDNSSNGIFTNASYNDEGAVADFKNLETTANVSPIPTSRIHSIHPKTQILRDPTSVIEPKKISQALED